MSTMSTRLAEEPIKVFETEVHAPLVLDLDGTLLRSDMLSEQALAFVKMNILNVFKIAVWLLRGKAFLKRKLATTVSIDIHSLPVNREIEALAAAEAAKGRSVYLATAADETIAKEVAKLFPFLTGVIASDGKVNLKGDRKAEALKARFPQGFDYAGNESADLKIWRVARKAILVDASPRVTRAAKRISDVEHIFPRHSRLRALIRSMRVHQWAKNLLIFVPAILSGRVDEGVVVAPAFIAFFALSLVSSATYIVNDALDLEEDRRHWSKRERPLASGKLPLLNAVLAVPAIMLAGLGLALAAGLLVFFAILAYIAVTITYSLYLKRVPILDAFVLASLFTLRLGIGILAANTLASPWLLVFSMFFFGSLSFAKRHTEISRVIARGGHEIAGRGYRASDLPLVLATGIATGMAAVLIIVLYIIDDAFLQSFYGNTIWLWGFPPLLFGFLSRVWLLSQRGELNDDPVAFAVTDKYSIMMGLALLLCFLLAWVG